jgi:hypothetical protein
MSAHHTWFGRSIARPRNRYGNISCPGAGRVVRGLGPSAAIPILRISRRARLRLTAWTCPRSIAATRERPGSEQLVDPPHQGEIVVVGRRRRPIDAGARDAEQLALSADRQQAMTRTNELPAVRGPHLLDLLAKNPAHDELADLGV